jgi:sugar phosphate isomerase/epimerase
MKIALSSYSIRNEWAPLTMSKVDALIAICKDLKIEAVELLNSEFTPENLSEEVKKFAENGITVFAIAIGLGVLAKPAEVEKIVSEGKETIRLAHAAGVKNIRLFVGDGPMVHAFPPMEDFDEEEWDEYREQMQDAVKFSAPVLTPLLELAEELDIYLGLETHHSYSSNYIYMEMLNKRFGSKHLGWIFDIGNYETDELRWKALEVIKGRTLYVHAKSYAFDDKGFETVINYPKACQILADAGFDGIWTMEFEGKMNGIYGVHKCNELLKYSIDQSAGKSYAMNLEIPSGEDLIKKYNDL